MITQFVPESIRSQLSGTIIESVYKEFQRVTTNCTNAEFYTPVASFEMLVPEGHPFLIKSGPDGEEHEPVLAHELNDNVTKDTVFYDVGARFGYHTLLMMELGMPESQIHAFEGDRFAFEILKKNHSEAANLTKSYISDGVNSLSLDKYISTHPQPDIVKIDVEGAEVEVLHGLEEHLNDEMALYIEVHPERMKEFGHKTEDLFQILLDNDYELYVADHRQDCEKLIPLSHGEDPLPDNYLLKAI